MDKIAIVILIILLIIVSLGLLVYFDQIKIQETSPSQEINTPTPAFTSSSTPDIEGVLPAIQPNALENKPDINPLDDANPIQDIKTNPFE